MKRKLAGFKTVQMVITLLLAGTALYVVLGNDAVYQAVGHDPAVRLLCVLLWVTLLLSFVCILIDFRSISGMNRQYQEMAHYVSNDPVAGIANRYSCDAVIERYADKPLPPTVGCIMLQISNLAAINQRWGHVMGNATIQAFSDVLSGASVGLCFVGRNGGNKFLALFEDCTQEKLGIFQTRVRNAIEKRSQDPDVPVIEYRCGSAFQEGPEVTAITRLIALADRRIADRKDIATGMNNRQSCDEIISRYQDVAIPEDLGVVMIELSNLREINQAHGRAVGNRVLKIFSDALRDTAKGRCFVGRNGGLRFLALYEHGTEQDIAGFIREVEDRITLINQQGSLPEIRCRCAAAFREEGVTEIGGLLSLAAQRLEA